MLANIDSSLNEETRRRKTATARDISQLTHLVSTLAEANANAVTSTTIDYDSSAPLSPTHASYSIPQSLCVSL